MWIVSVTIPRRVSITETQSLDAQATKRRSSLGCRASWLGCSPTAIREVVLQVGRIDDMHGPSGPVRDVEHPSGAGDRHVVRSGPYRSRLDLLLSLQDQRR